jgi:HEAT repeat protein
MRRSPKLALASALFLVFFNTSLLVAQTATTPPPSNSQAAAPPAVEGNVMIEELQSPNAGTRAKAARELGKAQDVSGLPALAEALADPSDKVRREVVLALAQMHQPEVLDALIKATRDNNEEISVLALQSLVGFYTGNVPTPGFSGFLKKNWQRAKGHFNPDTTRIDPGVYVDPKVVAALDAALKSTRSIHVSCEAAKGLGILIARAAVPDLVAAAHSSDETLSLESLNALSKIKDRSAGPQLVDLLDSPDKEITQQASVAVGILRASQAEPKLQQIYENGADPKSEEKAMEGLAYLGDKASVPVFTKALGSIDKEIRTSAAEGLARARDPKALPDLEKAYAIEKDAGARLALVFAMSALGKSDYLNDLVSELSSRTQWDVAQPYLIELARTPGFLPRLYPYLQSSSADVRKRLCTVLMFGGDQTSMDQLDRLSHDPNSDVAAQALQAKSGLRARLATEGTNGGTNSP